MEEQTISMVVGNVVERVKLSDFVKEKLKKHKVTQKMYKEELKEIISDYDSSIFVSFERYLHFIDECVILGDFSEEEFCDIKMSDYKFTKTGTLEVLDVDIDIRSF